MKKTLTILLVFVMLLIPLTGCNNEKSTTTTTNTTPPTTPASDFEYTVRRDETIAISKYIGKDTVVVIPDEIEGRAVTVISDAFYNNTVIESVLIPDTVTEIFDIAFYGCTNLRNVDLGNGVKKIGDGAFANCTSLTKLIIPKSLIELREGTFTNTTSLKTLIFEDGTTSINGYIFLSAKSVENIEIPASVTSIESPFMISGLKNITFIGDAPIEVAENVFGDSSDDVTINYYKNTLGWDDTILSQYNLVEN